MASSNTLSQSSFAPHGNLGEISLDENDYLGEASLSHADLETVPSMLLLSLESSLDEV